MTKKRGKDAKLYYLTTGTRAAWPESGSPSNLTEITNCRDVGLAKEKTEIDASTRDSDYEAILTGLKKAPLTFDMIYDPDDAAYTALSDAFDNDTTIALAVADGDIDTAGTIGFWADWEVLRFEDNQPLEGAYGVSVMLKPTARTSVAPELFTVAT